MVAATATGESDTTFAIRIESFETHQSQLALELDIVILPHNLAIAAQYYGNELLGASRSPGINVNKIANLKIKASNVLQRCIQIFKIDVRESFSLFP
jgi:hypothetical protein